MGDEIIHLNSRNFDSVTANEVWAIDCWAEWCGPCKLMEPEFEAAAKEMKDVNFAKLNVDEEIDIAQKFEVMSIPTILILKDGKEIGRAVGAKQKKSIIEEIKFSTQ